MATSTISVRVNDEIKEKSKIICKQMGMDLSTAINIFLCKMVNVQGIPFAVGADYPNDETISAMKEAEEMTEKGKGQFRDTDELFKDLGI